MDLKPSLEAAVTAGTERGRAAATWVFDGNTDEATYQRFLDLNEAGDPALHDEFGPSTGWLSGENAEGPTPSSLADDLALRSEADLDAVCSAYEDAADAAYWAEVERVANLQVGA